VLGKKKEKFHCQEEVVETCMFAMGAKIQESITMPL
jgi:hypothetical protein